MAATVAAQPGRSLGVRREPPRWPPIEQSDGLHVASSPSPIRAPRRQCPEVTTAHSGRPCRTAGTERLPRPTLRAHAHGGDGRSGSERWWRGAAGRTHRPGRRRPPPGGGHVRAVAAQRQPGALQLWRRQRPPPSAGARGLGSTGRHRALVLRPAPRRAEPARARHRSCPHRCPRITRPGRRPPPPSPCPCARPARRTSGACR